MDVYELKTHGKRPNKADFMTLDECIEALLEAARRVGATIKITHGCDDWSIYFDDHFDEIMVRKRSSLKHAIVELLEKKLQLKL